MRTCRLVLRADFRPKVFQLAPAVVVALGAAATIALVAVLPAFGANSPAGFSADQLHRQSKQYHFAQDIVQSETASFVIADFNTAGIDLLFAAARSRPRRHIDQIEMILNRKAGGFETPIAGRLHRHVQIALNPDFT